METPHTLARHEGPRGEVVPRRRSGAGPDVEELIVNGVFAMDSAETFTEQQLAELALAGRRPGAAVLVGGLGLGYTATALLAGGAGRLDLVEIEGCLVEWAYAGLTPTLAAVAADPRVRLHTGDVGAVLAGYEASGLWDANVLDVDNGPDFLVHEANADLYAAPGLAAAYARLSPGGVLAIWCQGPAPELEAALRGLSGTAAGHTYRRLRQGRELAYVIYTVTRSGPEAQE